MIRDLEFIKYNRRKIETLQSGIAKLVAQLFKQACF